MSATTSIQTVYFTVFRVKNDVALDLQWRFDALPNT